jgi:aspartate carbamoyltransferase catalytic subunit
VKHLLSIADLDRGQIIDLLDMADHMAEVGRRPVPKVPALRGKTVVNLFFEDSTRTRLSFDAAAKRLSADVMTFSASSSSVNKGESLRDTVETLTAMGADIFVVRHRSSGVPRRITEWTSASVVNAGDGWHQHPTQALLDCFTLREALCSSDLSGVRIAIVGDVRHSRVARSDVLAFTRLGASVVLVAPSTLLPPDIASWEVDVVHELDAVVADVDVIVLLRMQRERMDQALVPSLVEYTGRFGLTPERARRLRHGAFVMHPGPMNRGIEITVDPSSLPGSLVTRQVTNGVAVRTAVLYALLEGASSEVVR